VKNLKTGAKRVNPVTVIILLFAMIVTYLAYNRTLTETSPPVYVIPVKGDLTGGMADFVRRAVTEAKREKACAILVEISTFGGSVDAMKEIGEILAEVELPVYTFVNGKAISAGAYIALAGDKILMTPAAVMGASQPRTVQGKEVPEKEMSAIRKIFRAQAEARAARTGLELDPLLAEAMVDPEIEIPGVIAKGKLLTLTAKRAVELKYADYIVENRNEALARLGLGDTRIVQVTQTPVEGLVAFLTHPVVSSLLLTIGFTALIIEVFTAGFGLAGTVGIVSILLFFGARILSGLAGVEVLLLFFLGLILLVVEIFVTPGFGVAGIAGLASVGASVFLSYSNSSEALLSLGLSTVWTLVLAAFLFQYMKSSGLFQRLALQTAQTKEEGYTAVPTYEAYVGKEGLVVGTLRPAGTAEFDGERLDVVSEGEYLEAGTRVQIVRTEGRRIVVRKINE
jgi:membrane-bound serine protease (ClpP class)